MISTSDVFEYIGRIAGQPHDISLTITRSHENPGKFLYVFSENELVIPRGQIIVFHLNPLWNVQSKLFIAGFVCNRPDAAKHIKASPQGAPDFGFDVRHAAFTFDLAPNEMVNIGLIVGIPGIDSPTDPASAKYILCDPQVGNGPPGAGGFAPAPFILT